MHFTLPQCMLSLVAEIRNDSRVAHSKMNSTKLAEPRVAARTIEGENPLDDYRLLQVAATIRYITALTILPPRYENLLPLTAAHED